MGRWIDIVKGMLPDAEEVDEIGESGDLVAVAYKGGWMTISFAGRSGRSFYKGHGVFPNDGKRNGRYTGQGWHRRLIKDAWTELVSIMEG